MALIKSFQAVNGNTYTYWRIEKIDFQPKQNICVIRAVGYVDQAASTQEMAQRYNKIFAVGDDYSTYFDYSILDMLGENQTHQAYEFLKTQSFFSGATDA